MIFLTFYPDKLIFLCFYLQVSEIYRKFANEYYIVIVMCKIVLEYNEKDSIANEKLAALLATGLFTQHNLPVEPDIDYSDPSLYDYEAELAALPDGKESYTPEELRALLINDLNSIYGAQDAI